MDIQKIDLLEQKMILFHKHDPIRILRLVGHHYTYSNIDGIDYQIPCRSRFSGELL